MRAPTWPRKIAFCSSSTARNRAFFEAKWSYRTARVTPAASAIVPIPVGPYPCDANVASAAWTIRVRRAGARRRRFGSLPVTDMPAG
jgi:hypothetical protein